MSAQGVRWRVGVLLLALLLPCPALAADYAGPLIDAHGHLPNATAIEAYVAAMKRHDVGPGFYERDYDGTLRKEFMTEPLWGVGSSPPYGHDGRSINLREVILRHGGEAQSSRDAFARLSNAAQLAVLEFLNSLILFPPDDTASNLDPGDPSTADFPQRGHGSIRLTALFNDPNDPE